MEQWINAPIEGESPCIFLDGIWLKRCWAGEVNNVSILLAIAADRDGYGHILGVQESAKGDKESCQKFLRHLKSRGLKDVRLFVSYIIFGACEIFGRFLPASQAAALLCAFLPEFLYIR